jgi:hypothetical protein
MSLTHGCRRSTIATLLTALLAALPQSLEAQGSAFAAKIFGPAEKVESIANAGRKELSQGRRAAQVADESPSVPRSGIRAAQVVARDTQRVTTVIEKVPPPTPVIAAVSSEARPTVFRPGALTSALQDLKSLKGRVTSGPAWVKLGAATRNLEQRLETQLTRLKQARVFERLKKTRLAQYARRMLNLRRAEAAENAELFAEKTAATERKAAANAPGAAGSTTGRSGGYRPPNGPGRGDPPAFFGGGRGGPGKPSLTDTFNNHASLTKPEGIPDSWVMKNSKKGNGVKWVNPTNERDSVRLMPAAPKSTSASQRVQYVIDQNNGSFRDRDGKAIPGPKPGKTKAAHIPRDQFIFRR